MSHAVRRLRLGRWQWPKCGKHGVSKEEIEVVFFRSDLLVFRDKAHRGQEDRFLMIARRVGDHHGLLVGFTWREREGLRLIRPVTARYMHEKEVRSHG